MQRFVSLITPGPRRPEWPREGWPREGWPRGGWPRGTILVAAALIMAALIAFVGLVLDAGMLISSHRQCQNGADAGALAAAFELVRGNSTSAAAAAATTFVQQHNGMANSTLTVNIPPASGAYAGNSHYAEAIVSTPVPTRLMRVLGIAATNSVTARAVAGWEGNRVAAGIMSLNPDARPGIDLVGNGNLNVNGTVVVDSNGGGLNESGQPINNGNSGNAITTSGNGKLTAKDVESVGGVNDPTKIKNYDPQNPNSPLHTGMVPQPDPFQFLPPPTTANGAVATNYGAVKLSGNQSVTLSPGVYTSIDVSANVNVALNPGIYVITGGGISMSGNSTLTGSNVMIYNTGNNYNVATGLPDSGDGSSLPPAPGNPTFGGVSITGNASLRLTPLSNAASPFDGMVFYQRRLNTQQVSLSGNGAADVLSGTIYSKWATLNLSGNGTFNAQFIVSSVVFTGNGNMTIDVTNQHLSESDQVYLVE